MSLIIDHYRTSLGHTQWAWWIIGQERSWVWSALTQRYEAWQCSCCNSGYLSWHWPAQNKDQGSDVCGGHSETVRVSVVNAVCAVMAGGQVTWLGMLVRCGTSLWVFLAFLDFWISWTRGECAAWLSCHIILLTELSWCSKWVIKPYKAILRQSGMGARTCQIYIKDYITP